MTIIHLLIHGAIIRLIAKNRLDEVSLAQRRFRRKPSKAESMMSQDGNAPKAGRL
jgi:hypothetical protein